MDMYKLAYTKVICNVLWYLLLHQVETWLNSLLERMVATIRHNFMEAIVTYEEKPRDQWVFDPPAQVHKSSTVSYIAIHKVPRYIGSYLFHM